MRIILLAAILGLAQACPSQMKRNVVVDLQKNVNEPKLGMTSKSSETRQEFGETPKEPKYFGNETQQTISETSLQWLNKTAMKIVWPDEKEDIIFLNVSQQFPEMTDACIFEGSPGNTTSNTFSAAVVGCMDSDETIVNLGLKDKVLELLLLKNGTTLQETWIGSEHVKNLHLSRTKRQTQEPIETGGSLRSSQPSADRTGSTEEDLRMPKAITFPLDLGYDKTLYNQFGSHSATKRFISQIVNLAGPFFKPPFSSNAGLPTISWATRDIKSYFDVSLNADKMCTEGNRAEEEKKRFREGSTPLMLFVEDLHDGGYQTTGCAYETAACGNTRGEAYGIVDMTWDWYSETKHIQTMARTMAHEFGHLLGMHHDHDHAETSGCKGTGLMSYGKRPDAWSTCSVSDFQRWWRTRGFACKEITKDYDSTPNKTPSLLHPLIGPSDAGGKCPSPAYKYTWGGDDYCCYKDGCCWDKCTLSTPPANWLKDVPNSQWIYSKDLGYYQAMQNNGQMDTCSSIKVIGDSETSSGDYFRTNEYAKEAPENPVWVNPDTDRYIFNTGSSSGWRLGRKGHLSTGQSYYKGRSDTLPFASEKWTNSDGSFVEVKCARGFELENSGKDCWTGCGKKQGKCDFCGTKGYCCKKGTRGNECDGTIGGISGHRCVLKPEVLKNAGKDCWSGCNKKQGKCNWCGTEGYCCKKGTKGNGCDGTIGGSGHRCVLNP